MRVFIIYYMYIQLTDLNLKQPIFIHIYTQIISMTTMNTQQLSNFQSLSDHDQSLDPIIQQILPDIQQSIKRQLMQQLQQQAQISFQKQLNKIQMQALEEYQTAMNDLEQQGNKLLKQQTQELKKQLDKLNKDKRYKQENQMKHLQDKFISQNFQQVILNHPKIQQIQSILAIQIIQSSADKIQATKQRRMKQIIVRMQNKQQKYLKQKDKAIKNQIYQTKSIDELKKDIQLMKIGLASMKSQYNVKAKKIQAQIKQIKQRNVNLKPKQNINELRKQYELLKDKQQQRNDKILHQQQYQTYNNQNSNPVSYKYDNKNNSTFSHLDCSSEQESIQQPPTLTRTQYQPSLRRKTVLQQQQQNSQNLSQSDQYSQQNLTHQQDIVSPPIYHPSAQVSLTQQNLETYQTHAPILKLNIASLLRTNWEDPLQKYINQQNTYSFNTQFNSINHNLYENNQNDAKIGNKDKDKDKGPSFQQIYHQHLQKLNQTSKRRKLSMQTKKAIMRNLSMLNKVRT